RPSRAWRRSTAGDMRRKPAASCRSRVRIAYPRSRSHPTQVVAPRLRVCLALDVGLQRFRELLGRVVVVPLQRVQELAQAFVQLRDALPRHEGTQPRDAVPEKAVIRGKAGSGNAGERRGFWVYVPQLPQAFPKWVGGPAAARLVGSRGNRQP